MTVSFLPRNSCLSASTLVNMSIFQFPKHIINELHQLLPYLKEYISGMASTSHVSTPSSNFGIPAQILAHIPNELLYLVPYFEKVDQDHVWLLSYYKDFVFDEDPSSRLVISSAYQCHDRVHHNSSSDAKEDISFDDNSSDDSYDSSDSEDEFYECNMEFNIGCVVDFSHLFFFFVYSDWSITLKSCNTNGLPDQYCLNDNGSNTKVTDSEALYVFFPFNF